MVSLTSCLGCTQSKGERFLGHCDAVRFVHCDEERDSKNKGNGDSGAGHLITCAADKTTRIWSISNIKEDNAIALSSRQPASPPTATSPMVSVVVLPGNTGSTVVRKEGENILTLSQCGVLSLWFLDYDDESDNLASPINHNSPCKQIWAENLDPDFKDTFTSLSISKCTATFENEAIPQGGGHLVTTTSLLAGVCTWSLQILTSKSHFNLQKLSSWLSALQGPDMKEGKHGGRPLCSYLEPQNTKGLIIGFDDGSIKVKGQIAKELLQEKPLQKDQSSDLRITSISGPGQYSSFGKSRELPWSTVSLWLRSQNLFCLGDVSGQVHLLWNKKNNVIRKSQKIHNSSITGLAELDGKLVSTSLDGTIKLWNIPENNWNVPENNYPNISGTNLDYNTEEFRLYLSQECRLTQMGEFSTASGAPMTCLHAMSSDKTNVTACSTELPMETNEVISVAAARKRKRKGEDSRTSQHCLGQRLSTAGVIVAGDIAGGVYFIRAKTLTK